jgi:dihydrofolate reductase
MRKLTAFNSITVDGYFTDDHGDMGWAYDVEPDARFDAFVAGNAGSGGQLLFGRVTYELMAGYWPTAQALKDRPEVAEGMNRAQKVVFSRTLKDAAWSNTQIVKGDLKAAVSGLKQQKGPDMAILGSGSLIAQLAPLGLIDEYQMVLTPVALGGGRTMFEGIPKRLKLRLLETRAFDNGKVFLRYAPTR